MILCDVGPRDGLQNEARVLAPPVRAELVNRLAAAGLPRVEAASFVNPKLVPQMAGGEEVVEAVGPRDGCEISALALNERGFERLRAAGVARANFAVAATDTFGQRNANASVEEGVAKAERVLALAREAELPVTATISVAFGCPFEGEVDAGVVADLAGRAAAAGADEVVLSDTIGVATPRQVRAVVTRVAEAAGRVRVGGHFHNTRSTGFANAFAALEAGAEVLDASVGGLGGCPFAPGASGNVATEDLVYMLERDGVETGVDLDALVGAARWVEELLGHRVDGQLSRVGPFPPRRVSASGA